jgi:hypothetical protein
MFRKIVVSVLFALVGAASYCQQKTHLVSVSGTIKAFQPGPWFAYAKITFEKEIGQLGIDYAFFPEHYGERVFAMFKAGDEVEVAMEVPSNLRELASNLDAKKLMVLDMMMKPAILSITSGTKMLRFDWADAEKKPHSRYSVQLNKYIDSTFQIDGKSYYRFSGGMTVVSRFNTDREFKYLAPGVPVSFAGLEFIKVRGAVYPIENVVGFLFFERLFVATGHLASLLHKQNSVCIGLKVKTQQDEVELFFPSDRAREIRDFLANGKKAQFYYHGYATTSRLDRPPLHAIVRGRDTLKIESFFHGGADVEHSFTPFEEGGKITGLNLNEKGKLIGLVMNNQVYVDIDNTAELLVGKLLRRGIQIRVTGDERVKKDGEIYRDPFRIVSPRAFVIGGKTFLVRN